MQHIVNVAICNLGKIKREPMRSAVLPPIARDLRGGSLFLTGLFGFMCVLDFIHADPCGSLA